MNYIYYIVPQYHPFWSVFTKVIKEWPENTTKRTIQCKFGKFLFLVEQITEDQQGIDVFKVVE